MQEQIEAPEPPKMDIRLPSLSAGELIILGKWAEAQQETVPHFAGWLKNLVAEELARREFPDMEPEMMALPNWNGEELADALMGSSFLVHFTLSERQAAFVDQLHMFCMANAVAALQQFPQWVKL